MGASAAREEGGRVSTEHVRVHGREGAIGSMRGEIGLRTEHAPVLEEAEEADDFLMGLGGGLELDDGAVGPDDLVGGQDQEGRGDTDEDDDQERLWVGGEATLG